MLMLIGVYNSITFNLSNECGYSILAIRKMEEIVIMLSY